MILAKARTDELAAGFQGRLKRLNRCSSTKSLLKKLKKHFALEGQDIPRVVLLAKAAGLDIPEFCRGHTLIPFHRAVSNTQPGVHHGYPTDLSTLIYFSFKGLRSSASFCPECAEEALASRGHSNWKRKDQIPGFDWCSIHGIALMQCDKRLVSISMPSNAIGNKPDFVDTEKGDLGHPLVRRYMLICEGFLAANTPQYFSSANLLLIQRAQELGLQIGWTGNKESLSDLALQLAPTGWLNRLFQGTPTKEFEKYLTPLENVLLHGGSPRAYALALALLFESADDALDHWRTYAAPTGAPRSREQALER